MLINNTWLADLKAILCKCSSMVEFQSSTLAAGVRLPSLAPSQRKCVRTRKEMRKNLLSPTRAKCESQVERCPQGKEVNPTFAGGV